MNMAMSVPGNAHPVVQKPAGKVVIDTEELKAALSFGFGSMCLWGCRALKVVSVRGIEQVKSSPSTNYIRLA